LIIIILSENLAVSFTTIASSASFFLELLLFLISTNWFLFDRFNVLWWILLNAFLFNFFKFSYRVSRNLWFWRSLLSSLLIVNLLIHYILVLVWFWTLVVLLLGKVIIIRILIITQSWHFLRILLLWLLLLLLLLLWLLFLLSYSWLIISMSELTSSSTTSSC